MRIDQMIDELDIDLTGFVGLQRIDSIQEEELKNLKEVASPWPEDLDVVRKCLDQLLAQMSNCNASTDSGTPPSPGELKRIMGRCFRMGRKYEQLRSSNSLNCSKK